MIHGGKMATNKSPAFQFYPSDWLSDAKVQSLTAAQEGIYIRLLCYCWREGSLPSDGSAIAQLCKREVTELDIDHVLKTFFCERDGNYYNKRLDKERQKQISFAKERSKSGKLGAKKRWQKDDSSAIAQPLAQPMAKNSSSSSSSSSSTSTNILPKGNIYIPENNQRLIIGTERIYLTEDEIQKVKLKYQEHNLSAQHLKNAFEELDLWFKDNPKEYKKSKCHYRRMIGWVLDRAIERKTKTTRATQVDGFSKPSSKFDRNIEIINQSLKQEQNF